MMHANESVYPLTYNEETDSGKIIDRIETGLTKREYFAAMALQGILANPDKNYVILNDQEKAMFASEMASHLINELNKQP